MTFLDTNVLVYAVDQKDPASGCDEFWTEDLNDGQSYCGIKVVNPFK